jgi:hypothetical protein
VCLAARHERWVELVGEGTQAFGDDPVGAGAGFRQLAPRLLLRIVDYFRGSLLGRLDDRG